MSVEMQVVSMVLNGPYGPMTITFPIMIISNEYGERWGYQVTSPFLTL